MAIMTIRSYEITQEGTGGESFEDLLQRIFQLDNSKRKRGNDEDCIIWLSRYERDGDIVSGEFVRVRKTNFPMLVSEQGMGNLPLDKEDIGQGAAFRYRISDNRLYIQYDARVVSTGRAINYLNLFTNNKKFFANVRVSQEAWDKLKESDVKDLHISVAKLGELKSAGAYKGSILKSMSVLSEALAPPSLTIKVGMGQIKGKIDNSVKEEIEEVLQLQEDGTLKVKSIRIKMQGASDEKARNINMLNDILSTKVDIGFPKNEHEKNYKLRSQFLETLMKTNAL